MILVVDASIAVKAVTQEAGSDEAAALLARVPERIAPDFLRFEMASALSKKMRLSGLPPAQAADAMAALPLIVPTLFDTVALIEPATALSRTLDHALFDCFYVALALAHDATLVTADRKLLSSAALGGYGDRVRTLDLLAQL